VPAYDRPPVRRRSTDEQVRACLPAHDRRFSDRLLHDPRGRPPVRHRSVPSAYLGGRSRFPAPGPKGRREVPISARDKRIGKRFSNRQPGHPKLSAYCRVANTGSNGTGGPAHVGAGPADVHDCFSSEGSRRSERHGGGEQPVAVPAAGQDAAELDAVEFQFRTRVTGGVRAAGRSGEGERERLPVSSGQSVTTSATMRPSWSADRTGSRPVARQMSTGPAGPTPG
jgi:hypothetical protein